jgi:hypothetical protein
MSTPRSEDPKGQVLPFRQRKHARAGMAKRESVEGLEKYEDEPDDYRRRMINNGLALVFCIVLVGIGVWIANTMAEVRRKQDCVLSGRRDCATIVAPSAGPK